jgi:hypothetical protein
MRTDVDDSVLGSLLALAKDFVGLSRKECIETWLELVSSDATPSQTAREVASVLAEEGDVPNLDFAVAKCLQIEALAYGKKGACMQYLVPVIPMPRRRAAVWKFLEEMSLWGMGGHNIWNDLEQNVIGRGSEPIDPALAEIFLAIAERNSGGDVRGNALYVVGRHEKPTPAILERVVKLAYDPRLAPSASRAVADLVDRAPQLETMALAALTRVYEEGGLMRQKNYTDPRGAVKQEIQSIENRAKYRKK